jgi:hypothetical protein
MIEYSALIRNLARHYYDGKISMGEYRAQRREIIDRMEREYNGFDRLRSPFPADAPQGGQDDFQM